MVHPQPHSPSLVQAVVSANVDAGYRYGENTNGPVSGTHVTACPPPSDAGLRDGASGSVGASAAESLSRASAPASTEGSEVVASRGTECVLPLSLASVAARSTPPQPTASARTHRARSRVSKPEAYVEPREKFAKTYRKSRATTRVVQWRTLPGSPIR